MPESLRSAADRVNSLFTVISRQAGHIHSLGYRQALLDLAQFMQERSLGTSLGEAWSIQSWLNARLQHPPSPPCFSNITDFPSSHDTLHNTSSSINSTSPPLPSSTLPPSSFVHRETSPSKYNPTPYHTHQGGPAVYKTAYHRLQEDLLTQIVHNTHDDDDDDTINNLPFPVSLTDDYNPITLHHQSNHSRGGVKRKFIADDIFSFPNTSPPSPDSYSFYHPLDRPSRFL